MKNNIVILSFLLFTCYMFSQGQTVNTGTLYVSDNTLMTVISDFKNHESGVYENNGEVLLRANFDNNGITTFDPNKNGYTRFEGFLNQNISGSFPADFYDVLFQNNNEQPAFRLSGDISVSGNADFMNGIVNNDDFGGIIIFEENATHSNVDNSSHVDGFVQKNGREDFIYPIGDKNFYRYSQISPPGQNGVMSSKYIFEDSNSSYPHSQRTGVIDVINDREYWILEKESDSDDVLLTLSWDTSSTTPAHIVAQPYEAVHIVRWDENQNLWIDEGGVVDANAKTVTTSARVSGYGVFTFARVKTDKILPGDIVIYNGLSPDLDDGKNDYFIIDNINLYPNNRVTIFNRWGVKLFETKNYDSKGNVFRGYSNARATIDGSEKLPSGNYFYVVEYEYNGDGKPPRTIKKAGYLYLQAD